MGRRRDHAVPVDLNDRADLEARRRFSGPGTNGRKGCSPVCNPVLVPDPSKMMEVSMNDKRVIGVDIGKSWLDAAWEDAERVQRYSNDAGRNRGLDREATSGQGHR